MRRRTKRHSTLAFIADLPRCRAGWERGWPRCSKRPACGVPRYDHTQADRVNRGRLESFRRYVADRRQPGALATLLTSDTPFRTDPDGAYAEAWALSFYLCETQPRLYAAYLEKTAQRPLFIDYPAAERSADFQSFFGNDLKLFDAKFLRYMEGVK